MQSAVHGAGEVERRTAEVEDQEERRIGLELEDAHRRDDWDGLEEEGEVAADNRRIAGEVEGGRLEGGSDPEVAVGSRHTVREAAAHSPGEEGEVGRSPGVLTELVHAA